MSAPPQQFPYVPRDPSLGNASLAPMLPLTLVGSQHWLPVTQPSEFLMRIAACMVIAFMAMHPRNASADEAPCPDVEIVVFRHHPGLIDTKERMDARDRDEKMILKAAKDHLSGLEYSGGLGRGYELSIHARDLGRWKNAIDKLLKAGTLKYYDSWGLDRNGYGFVPVR